MERLFHVKLLQMSGSLGKSTASGDIVIVLEIRSEFLLG
jgi:hypothetical protein